MIVVAGEALYDLVPGDDGRLAAHPGGGPFNTARAIGRLEQPVGLLSRISTDHFGKRHVRMLAEDGVDLRLLTRTHDPTTLAVAELDESGRADYRFYSTETAAPGLDAEGALAALPAAVEALHVGTLGLVFEPIGTALEALVERVHHSVLVMVDPNCRPAAIADEPAYRARLERLFRRTHVLKLSEDDARWLAPDRRPLDWARGVRALGPAAVLLTRGGDGSVVLTRREESELPASRVDVVDTIGAGDAFGGAFLAWWRARALGAPALADHALVVEAARFASRAAALTCTRAGAAPPHLGELRDTS